ncbi:putative endopeptidase [Sphingomonas vulcanisoli]|uniref:Endopeptidase n=1 Tax=Sphingomonas vulcanisoli TaxID=1658060 RepID=A0ABX0TSU2_9SPHN|nr:M13 family metallopeptidase [Sphingomonas vulcanisoli]NIJ07814.1 putative endopeptidase [Sphingomonas vulcanisoli]
MTKHRLIALATASLLAIAGAQPGAAADAPLSAAKYAPWGIDLAGGDHSVKPGDDFDRYVNGTWYDHATIDPDIPYAGPVVDNYKLSQVQLRTIIEESPKTSPIGAMFGSFMDEARVEALDAKPLAPDIARVAATRDKTAFAALMGANTRGFGATLFGFEIIPDPRHPVLNVLAMGQDGLGLPDRDYYLKAQFKPQLDAYHAYVERLFGMIGYPDPKGSADAVLAFETKVAQVSWSAQDRRDIVKVVNPMTLPEIEAYAPGVPWKTYLDAATFTHPGTIIVGEKTAIKALAALYAETPLATLQAWEAFHVAHDASPYLSKRFVDSRFAFTRTLSGVSQQRPRWKRGVQLVDGSLGELVGKTYVERYFTPAAKAEMVSMIANLKAAMHDRIEGLTWMSPATKTHALEKLSRMRVMVGYPDKWRSYAALRIDPNDLYGNVQRSQAFEFAYHADDLGKPVDHQKWGMTPQTVNAYNNGLENVIVFPAGYLQPPSFNPAADPAVNYGAIGAVIGHEISHGFDDQGRKIDATGALRDWWTPEDAKRFEAQAAGFGAQYDSYEPVPGMHVNGKLTMGENIADMAGLLVALDAYHRSLGGKPAPMLDGFTGDQRFFMAHAQENREKANADALRSQMASDPHTPSKFRAIGPERNIDAWYQAFDVTPGQKYYIAPDKRTRIW